MTAEWVSAVAEGITACSVVLLYLQVRDSHSQLKSASKQLEITAEQLKLTSAQLLESHKQMQEDHERSRKQMAVDKTLEWASNLSRSSSSARRLVDLMDERESRDLEKAEKLSIAKAKSDLLYACFPKEEKFEATSECLILTSSQSSELRFIVVKYLNTLEGILSAWRHNVADREMLAEQFRYMLEPRSGAKLLRNFRVALGEENYPSIQKFEEYLISTQRPGPDKQKTGI